MTDDAYVGEELDFFAHAKNWKGYLRDTIRPHLRGRVLEVGAGIGGTTAVLADENLEEWLCLEPDPALEARIADEIAAGRLPGCCRSQIGAVARLADDQLFDAILYIDVLEHIEDDGAELERSSAHLAPGGRLIVLSPAWQWLYSPFDEAIGHYRRYSRATLQRVAPTALEEERVVYLDLVGLLASAGNALLLRQSMPTLKQVLLWDRRMIPLSRRLDRVIRFRAGKSVLGIWRRNA